LQPSFEASDQQEWLKFADFQTAFFHSKPQSYKSHYNYWLLIYLSEAHKTTAIPLSHHQDFLALAIKVTILLHHGQCHLKQALCTNNIESNLFLLYTHVCVPG
jgi:hypothetical protein